MSAGARKGERRGGRGKGTPNRLSSTRVARTVSEGRKLPPDELLRNAEDCRAEVARYAPTRLNPKTGLREANPDYDGAQYRVWLADERDGLKAACPFYAPRLMAVAVKTLQDTEDHDRDDPRRIMYDVYAQMRERGQIRLKELAPPTALPPEIKTNGGGVTIEAKVEEDDDGDGVAS